VHISLPALRKKEQIVIFIEGFWAKTGLNDFDWKATGAPLQNRNPQAVPSIKKKDLNKKRKGLTKKERLPAKLKSALVHISFPVLKENEQIVIFIEGFLSQNGPMEFGCNATAALPDFGQPCKK
jgi:hypothetical protein